MKNGLLPEAFLKKVLEYAEAQYPQECCGLLLGPAGEEKVTRVYPCRNLQDEYHAKDPEVFPRTSRNGYWMDPAELLKIQKEMRSAKEEIKIIYHSHIDAGAYFSEEDQRKAQSEGEPLYPGVLYFVVSVMNGTPGEMCFYQWSAALKSYQKI